MCVVSQSRTIQHTVRLSSLQPGSHYLFVGESLFLTDASEKPAHKTIESLCGSKQFRIILPATIEV